MANLNALAEALLGWNALSKDDQRKRAAWEKAFPIPRHDATVIRSDFEDKIIKWAEYGQQSSYGWEIDHITPIAIGGTDTLDNLRARHFRRGNRSAGAFLGNALAGAGVEGAPADTCR